MTGLCCEEKRSVRYEGQGASEIEELGCLEVPLTEAEMSRFGVDLGIRKVKYNNSSLVEVEVLRDRNSEVMGVKRRLCRGR